MEEIIAFIKEQMAQGLYPGASLAVFHQGAWQEFYLGESDPDQGQKTEADMVYDLASVSKVVGVGTIFAQLYEKGQLDLDLPLKEVYPLFQNPQVTFRQLLTHTSGLDPFIPNRAGLDAAGLKAALHHLGSRENQDFHYTDVNFLLLGFYLEELFRQSLADLFAEKIFRPWGMTATSFGPRIGAVPTVRGLEDGLVHDPKARVLGKQAGSAGLFSTLADLEIFLDHYLQDDFAENLLQNFADGQKTRSLGWDLEGDWLDHTGYTGPFILFNRRQQLAAIFLTNRTYDRDDRPLWIDNRRQLMTFIKENLEKLS